MDWLELIKYLAGILPPGILGAVIVIVAGLYIHRSKKIPWKIVRTGINGSTQITSDMLEKNCTEYHGPLDEKLMRQDAKLDSIYERQTTVLSEMSNIRGYLEGSKRQPAGRR